MGVLTGIENLGVMLLFYCCGGWMIAQKYDRESRANTSPEFERITQEYLGSAKPYFGRYYRAY